MKRNPVKHSDIVYHGRNVYGLSRFTCFALGLGQYSTDERGRKARQLARDYFGRLAVALKP